jgi:hypothetical protein
MRVLPANSHKFDGKKSKNSTICANEVKGSERQGAAGQMTSSRLQRTAAHDPTALSRGERVSGSGAFISRSVTGEGSVHLELTPPCRDHPTGQAYFSATAIRSGLEGYGESMAALTRVSGTNPVGNGSNPSPGPRRLTKAPPRSTLSLGRGLSHGAFVRLVLAGKAGAAATALQNWRNKARMSMKTKDRCRKLRKEAQRRGI